VSVLGTTIERHPDEELRGVSLLPEEPIEHECGEKAPRAPPADPQDPTDDPAESARLHPWASLP